MPLDDILNMRIERGVRARYARLARQPEHRGRDAADLMRMALEDFCLAEEKKLGMKPITADEIEQFHSAILADRTRAPGIKPMPPKRPVSYRKRRSSNNLEN